LTIIGATSTHNATTRVRTRDTYRFTLALEFLFIILFIVWFAAQSGTAFIVAIAVGIGTGVRIPAAGFPLNTVSPFAEAPTAGGGRGRGSGSLGLGDDRGWVALLGRREGTLAGRRGIPVGRRGTLVGRRANGFLELVVREGFIKTSKDVTETSKKTTGFSCVCMQQEPALGCMAN
jgi:hypothetical protein